MRVYFISGLGADERVFQFLDLPGINKQFIKWIDPEEDETLQEYSRRLIAQIDVSERIILIGISFGGIVAQEISRIIACEKVIIISSIKSPEELGRSLVFVKMTQLHKLFPATFLKWSNRLTADYFFSTKSKSESILLQQIIAETDNKFMRWAINQILCWDSLKVDCPLVHIHGTRDRIFDIGPIRNAVKIEHGGHFMIVNQAAKISKLIMDEIAVFKKSLK